MYDFLKPNMEMRVNLLTRREKNVLEDFFTFVDVNSQPNGRSENSSGPRHYFLSKFTTIKQMRPTTMNVLGILLYVNSTVHSWNLVGGTCSNGSAHNWLKKNRPKVSVCPKQDYCDTCSQRKEQIRAKQTTINQLLAASADDKRSLEQSLERHRKEAEESHKYYAGINPRGVLGGKFPPQIVIFPPFSPPTKEIKKFELTS